MAGTSSVNLKGTIDLQQARRKGEIPLIQIIGGIEIKQYEIRIPPNQTSFLVIPMPFSTGVSEALWVHMYSPKEIILEETFTDTDTGAPVAVRRGFKGHRMDTYSPGEGLTTLRAKNLSTTEESTLEISFAALEASGDPRPDFWPALK